MTKQDERERAIVEEAYRRCGVAYAASGPVVRAIITAVDRTHPRAPDAAALAYDELRDKWDREMGEILDQAEGVRAVAGSGEQPPWAPSLFIRVGQMVQEASETATREAYEQSAKVCETFCEAESAKRAAFLRGDYVHDAARCLAAMSAANNIAARIRALSPAASTPPLATVDPGRELREAALALANAAEAYMDPVQRRTHQLDTLLPRASAAVRAALARIGPPPTSQASVVERTYAREAVEAVCEKVGRLVADNIITKQLDAEEAVSLVVDDLAALLDAPERGGGR